MRTKGIGPRSLGHKSITAPPLYTSAEYKKLYDNGSIMSVNEDGELTDQLDEVVLKAYNRNNLSEDEKKVYDKFNTGKLNKFTTNPDYDPSQKISKTNKPKIKAENPKRDFRNTQNIRHGGESFVLDAYGAVKMFKDSGASLSEEPNITAKIFKDKFRVNSEEPDDFRGHITPLTSTIHVGKKNKLSTVVAELAHVFPGMAANPTIKGTYEKTKRFFKEKKIPDKSNYRSEHDLEYKTHTGPNSVENRLLRKYGTQYR